MKKTRTTKQALILCALSLLLCMSMFVGSTFAWFTDSVSSAKNTIVAGNLDIGVYYAYPSDVVNGDVPADAWKPVTAQSSLFNPDALWEPGYTEAVFLKFANEGTLALQYQLQVDILKETIGKTKENADIQLSNFINAYACNSFEWNYKDFLFTEREDAIYPDGAPNPYYDTLYNAANGGVATPSGDNPLSLDSWQWLEPEETTYATLVLWMPTTVGNEANHNGKDIPQIDLGVTVLATQYTYEKDSFDDQYDKDADYVTYDYKVTSLDELKEAFANGGTVVLNDDVKVLETLRVEPGVTINLDLNGKTITVPDNMTSSAFNALFYSENGSNITISGNGKVDLGKNGMSLIVTRGNVTIENGTFIRTVTDPNSAYPLISDSKYADGNGTTVINGGYFDAGYYDANAAVFTETPADEATRGMSSDKNAYRVAIKDNITGTLNLSKSTFKVYGGTFVGANPAWGDEGCAMPITPDYLRPWSYYQGTFLDGQQVYDDKIVIPDGYTITESVLTDGRPVYTVEYSK